MSLDRLSTFCTFVPAATSTSYIVTVGPRCAPVTRAATPKVTSVRSSASMTSSSARPSAVDAGAVRSRSIGGNR